MSDQGADGGLAYGVNTWVREKQDDGDLGGGLSANQSGTSVFDPVLCELMVRWFTPPGGLILDPFAGGSVRGIVASRLGRKYFGVELRPEQVEANTTQVHLATGPTPMWVQGDSCDLPKLAGRRRADAVLTCPPYADLKVYSDDERDLSNMPYDQFRDRYAQIIGHTAGLLKDDSFAVFVVGDARGRDGLYYGLPEDTVAICRDHGLGKYNDAVLLTPVGSLPIRAGRQFTGSRKLGKAHQNVLIFVKGDPVAATEKIGEVEFDTGEDEQGDDAEKE